MTNDSFCHTADEPASETAFANACHANEASRGVFSGCDDFTGRADAMKRSRSAGPRTGKMKELRKAASISCRVAAIVNAPRSPAAGAFSL